MAFPETGMLSDRYLIVQDMKSYQYVEVLGNHTLVKAGLVANPGKCHAPTRYCTEDYKVICRFPKFIVHQEIRLVIEICPLV